MPGQEYIQLYLGACDDCAVAIANDDYTGMDDAREAAVRAGNRTPTGLSSDRGRSGFLVEAVRDMRRPCRQSSRGRLLAPGPTGGPMSAQGANPRDTYRFRGRDYRRDADGVSLWTLSAATYLQLLPPHVDHGANSGNRRTGNKPSGPRNMTGYGPLFEKHKSETTPPRVVRPVMPALMRTSESNRR